MVSRMLFCGVVNVSTERVAYRPLRHAPRLAPLITAVGMSFVLEGLMFLWRGPFNLHYPSVLPADAIPLGASAATIPYKDMAVSGTAILLLTQPRLLPPPPTHPPPPPPTPHYPIPP